MRTWNKDRFAGCILIGVGLWLSWYCYANYSLGSLAKMGPGMFPFGLGLILEVLGLVVIAQGQVRSTTIEVPNLRGPIVILGAIALFAMLVKAFGVTSAIVALVFVSSLAEGRFRPVSTLMLCGALIAFAYVVFGMLLGLPITFLKVPVS